MWKGQSSRCVRDDRQSVLLWVYGGLGTLLQIVYLYDGTLLISCSLFLLPVLAYFLPNAATNFPELPDPLVEVRIRQESVPAEGIDVEEHRAAEMRDVERLEKPYPSCHEPVALGVEHQHVRAAGAKRRGSR